MMATLSETSPKQVLITGGNDGIGLELAKLYASQECKVIITGRRKIKDVQPNLSQGIHYIEADQINPEKAATAIVDGLAEQGWAHCDLAILNAGHGKTGNPLEENIEELRRMIDVNLAATIQITHTLAPLLQAAARGNILGKLVVIGSTSHRGAKNFASYAAVKAGLHGFVRSLREEWRGRIDVMIIHPGPTATAMHEKAGFNPGLLRKIFIRPDAMARHIQHKITKARSPVSIGFGSKIRDLLIPSGKAST